MDAPATPAPASDAADAKASLDTSRLETLADSIFAISMTFLVFDLKDILPNRDAVAGAPGAAGDLPTLGRALLDAWPHYAAYAVSFLVLGLLWAAHHFASHYLGRTDRVHIWLKIAQLAFVALIPFGAALLAEHGDTAVAVIVYGAIAAMATALLWAQMVYAAGGGGRLLADDADRAAVRTLLVRLPVVVACYVAAMLVAAWFPRVGLGMFVLTHVALVFRPLGRAEQPA